MRSRWMAVTRHADDEMTENYLGASQAALQLLAKRWRRRALAPCFLEIPNFFTAPPYTVARFAKIRPRGVARTLLSEVRGFEL
jgi:hypothetical protein